MRASSPSPSVERGVAEDAPVSEGGGVGVGSWRGSNAVRICLEIVIQDLAQGTGNPANPTTYYQTALLVKILLDTSGFGNHILTFPLAYSGTDSPKDLTATSFHLAVYSTNANLVPNRISQSILLAQCHAMESELHYTLLLHKKWLDKQGQTVCRQ